MVITNMTYFLETLEYASKIGDESLMKCIKRLSNYESGANNPEGYWPAGHPYAYSTVTLHQDYDAHSFYFSWDSSDGRRIMNGGVIFHGNPGEADNSHSVTLERTYGWSIHT